MPLTRPPGTLSPSDGGACPTGLFAEQRRSLGRKLAAVVICGRELSGELLQRLQQQAAYGYRPVLLESFVELGRYQGTCYQAANWQAIGLSAGRGRQDAAHAAALPRKMPLVYPLQKDFWPVALSGTGTAAVGPAPGALVVQHHTMWVKTRSSWGEGARERPAHGPYREARLPPSLSVKSVKSVVSL